MIVIQISKEVSPFVAVLVEDGASDIQDFLVKEVHTNQQKKQKTNNKVEENLNNSKFTNKVRENLDAWKLLNNKFVFNIISKGIKIFFKDKKSTLSKLSKKVNERYLSNKQKSLILDQIKILLEYGVLSKISYNSKIFPNHLFCVISEHKSTKVRLIFDMKPLNDEIHIKTFKSLKLSSIFSYFLEYDLAVKLDLSKAYLHIPINSKFKKFFTFSFMNVKFKWNNMPFGLSTAPYLFSKVMEAILAYIRSKFDIQIYFYLDDFILLGNEKGKLSKEVSIVVEFFTKLGLTINYEKSILEPCHDIEFLGIKFNLEEKTMSPSTVNINKCIGKSQAIIKSNRISRRQLESLIGSLNFVAPYVDSGKFKLNPIKSTLSDFRRPRDALLKTPKRLKENLMVWKNLENYEPIPIKVFIPEFTMFVDASKVKWGALITSSLIQHHLQGSWSIEDLKYHINIKETLAILYSLAQIPIKFQNSSILIYSDSKTAVSTIQKMGSIHSLKRQKIMEEILKITKLKNVQIQATHLKGLKNCAADNLSRSDHVMPQEISISSRAFQNLCETINLWPQIDLFATPLNKKVEKFASSIPHVSAVTTNAFTIDWSKFQVLYAFPPPNLIYKVLFKWSQEKMGSLILIAPNLPAQNWFIHLHKKSLKTIELKLQEEDLYILTSQGQKFFQPKKFHLTAFIL